MKELKELGFDTSKASMAWLHWDNDEDDEWMVAIHNDDCYELSAQTCVPTFTVDDLLEFLPEKINDTVYPIYLIIRKWDGEYVVEYPDSEYIKLCHDKHLINALFKMLKRLVIKKFIKK
jgi:hypothetical protein